MENPLTLDEMIFEHRNKDYGAYELRTTYSSTMNRAMWISIVAFSALFITPYIFAHQKEKPEKMTEINLHMMDVQKEEMLPNEKIKVKKFMPPKVVATNTIEEVPPRQAELGIAAIGVVDKDGAETTSIISEVEAAHLRQEIKTITNLTVITCYMPIVVEEPLTATVNEMEEDENEDFLSVAEVNPLFKGGLNEMHQFLDKILKYPAEAQNQRVEGRVFVSFIVEKDGSLTDVKVIKGIGSGCDEEVIRAVRLMPKWIPGKQNGRNVRARFTIPVKFELD